MAKKSKNLLKRKKTFSGSQILLFVLAFAAVGAVAVWQSLAAPHSGSGGKGTTYTGTVSGPVMVTDQNGDGLPNYGDTITFKVTTNDPYQNYFVRADCYQNNVQVWETTQGLYSGWLWGTDYVLAGYVWKSGPADCTATFYYQTATHKGSVETNMASLNFHVNP